MEKINFKKYYMLFLSMDLAMQIKIFKDLFMSLATIICAIGAWIVTKKFVFFIILLLYSLGIFANTLYILHLCFTEQIYRYEGICTEVFNGNGNRSKKKKKTFMERTYILLKADTQENNNQLYYQIYTSTKKYRVGDKFVMYARPKDFMQKNDNTFFINSYVLLSVSMKSSS